MGTRMVRFCDCCGSEGPGVLGKRWLSHYVRVDGPKSLITREVHSGTPASENTPPAIDLCTDCLHAIDDAVCAAVDKRKFAT